MGIAGGIGAPGGVVCVCGKDQAQRLIMRRLPHCHSHSPEGQGLGRQRTTSHYGINLYIRAGPGIPGENCPLGG